MKVLGVILGILVLLAVITYFNLKTIWDKIHFDFAKGFREINLSGFNVEQFLLTGQTKINPTLGIFISNDNAFSIPFKDLKATIYYDGTVIGDTTDDLYNKHFTIQPKSTLTVTDAVNIYLNVAGGKLLLNKIKGQNPELRYTIKLKIQIFGMWIPVSYEDTFPW